MPFPRKVLWLAMGMGLWLACGGAPSVPSRPDGGAFELPPAGLEDGGTPGDGVTPAVDAGNPADAGSAQGGVLPWSCGRIADATTMDGSRALPSAFARLTETEKAKQRADAITVQAAIAKALASGVSYTVPTPGMQLRYNPVTAHAPFLRVSSHTAPFTLDFNGATLWLEDQNTTSGTDAISLSRTKNLTVENLVIDYDPLPFTQGTVVSLFDSGTTHTARIRVDEAFRTVVPSFQQRPPDDNDASRPFLSSDLYAPDSCRLKCAQTYFRPLPFFAKTQVAPGVWDVRILPANSSSSLSSIGFAVGDRIAMSQRGRPAIELGGCGNVVLENIRLHAFGLPGIADVQAESKNTYRRIQLVRREDTTRLLAGNADGIHVTNAHEGPTIEDSHFEALLDDAVNIHGKYQYVLHQDDATTLVVANKSIGNAMSASHLPAPINFYRWDTFQFLSTGTVQSFTALPSWTVPADVLGGNHGYAPGQVISVYRLKLSAAVSITGPTTMSMDAYAGPGSIIRNNTFFNLPVRGVLFQSTRGLIQGNRFTWVRASAVLVGPESPEKWMESTHPDAVTVENNVFDQTHFGYPSATTLLPLPGQAATDIAIKNNTTTPAQCP